MRFLRGLSIGIGAACLLVPLSFGQTVVSFGDSAKELKRTAHQLRISVDHLKNARTALKEATLLAQRSTDSTVFSQLAMSWTRLDRTKAPQALEDLYAWLRTSAQDAKDAQAYQRFKSSAQSLLRPLATLDSDRAVALWRLWPDPPTSLGEDFRRSSIQSSALFAKQLAGSASGPVAGPDLAVLSQAAATGSYSSAGMLATQLIQSGDRAEALKVVDQAIVDFSQREPDQRTLPNYLSFVRQLPNVDPNRYLQALSALMPALQKQASPNAGGTVTVGNQTLQLTAQEATVIDLCRNLMGRPDLAMKTLNTMPGLKSKLDPIGGIDAIVSPPRGTQDTVSMTYSIDGMSRTNYTSGGNSSSLSTTRVGDQPGRPSSPVTSGMDLYQSLRGKLAKDPEFVRQKLAEASRTPEQIDALIMLANRANMQDPDLASAALESATGLLMQVEPLMKRASVLQNLMRSYQSCEGEVDPGLLQKGLELVQQLRDEEKDRPMPAMPQGAPVMRTGGASDQLELAIVAELALSNFDSTMSYLRLLPELLKLQALVRIVQSLSQSY